MSEPNYPELITHALWLAALDDESAEAEEALREMERACFQKAITHFAWFVSLATVWAKAEGVPEGGSPDASVLFFNERDMEFTDAQDVPPAPRFLGQFIAAVSRGDEEMMLTLYKAFVATASKDDITLATSMLWAGAVSSVAEMLPEDGS